MTRRTPIPDQQFREVCRPGEGERTCRYITAGAEGIECEKHTPLGFTLDQRAEKGLMVARGDNCVGIIPSHTPLTGKSGTWEEDMETTPVTILADNTDHEGIKLRVKITGGREQGREFDAFCSWRATAGQFRAMLWTLHLPDGTEVP